MLRKNEDQTSFKEGLKRLPPAQLLRRLESKDTRARMAPAERRAWVKELRKRITRVRCQARSLTWYDDILSGQAKDLPEGVECPCLKCLSEVGSKEYRRTWPSHYMRGRISWECWVESLPRHIADKIPGSPGSVVRMKDGVAEAI